MNLDRAHVLYLRSRGLDTMQIAECIVGTKYEPDRAQELVRQLEPQIMRIIWAERDRQYDVKRRRQSFRMVSKEATHQRIRPSAPVSLPELIFMGQAS